MLAEILAYSESEREREREKCREKKEDPKEGIHTRRFRDTSLPNSYYYAMSRRYFHTK